MITQVVAFLKPAGRPGVSSWFLFLAPLACGHLRSDSVGGNALVSQTHSPTRPLTEKSQQTNEQVFGAVV